MAQPAQSPPHLVAPVAVVGMGAALPGASSADELWTLLRQGEPAWTSAHGYDPVGWDDFFDPRPEAEDRTVGTTFGGVSQLRAHPRLREELECGRAPGSPAAQWLRHSLLQALDTAAVTPGGRCLFAVGISAAALNELEQALVVEGAAQRLGTRAFGPGARNGDRVRELFADRYPFAGAAPQDALPHRVVWHAQRGLLPPGAELVAVDTACSAGMFCVDIGIRALRAGDADVAFCGGVNTITAGEYVSMSKVGGVSPTGRLRAFDVEGDGSVFSEGAALVALKLLDRARADGDQVLAVIAGSGTSSDGRGTGIFTPDATGQRLAVERAREAAGTPAGEIDWMIAHAIGMPPGDLTEFTGIAAATPDGRCPVTSYKSLLGHPSYASGVISVINAALGLRHGLVPAQRCFTSTPASYGDSGAQRRVPVHDVPLPPRHDRARFVGASCFGFGGTNCHVVVTDASYDRRPAPAPPSRDDVVLVGWGVHLPGAPSRAELLPQLRVGSLSAPMAFASPYPTPSPLEVGMPPLTMRRVGRCHPMILQSVNELARHHGELWAGMGDTTAVYTGFTGSTGTAVDYQLRIHLRSVRRALERAGSRELLGAVEEYEHEIRASVPPVSEDTVISMLTNCVAARVSKRFGLRGPTMNVDQGLDSTLVAVRLAIRALRTGGTDLVLVSGLSCGPGPEVTALLERLNPGLPTVAEGAFTLALTTERTATARHLDVLARLRPHRPESPQGSSIVRNGPGPDRTYLGADGAIALLRAATSGDDVLVLPHCGPFGASTPDGLLIRTC